MIVTLTPNPSHDRTVTLTAPLERGAVQRASSVLSLALPIGPKPNAAAAATRADFSYRLAGSSIPYFSKRM